MAAERLNPARNPLIIPGPGNRVEFIGPARRHIYKRGRTICGNRTYKTGFSPCELALPEGAMAPLEGYYGDPLCIAKVQYDSGRQVNDLHKPRGTQSCGKDKHHRYHQKTQTPQLYHHDYRPGPRLSDADMQAAADLLGLSNCHYLTDEERAAQTEREVLRYKGDGRDDGYLLRDLIEKTIAKELRTDLPHLDPLKWRAVVEEKTP